jgi:hypothetical protein
LAIAEEITAVYPTGCFGNGWDPMPQCQINYAPYVLAGERLPLDVRSIKMFCSKAGKDFVKIIRGDSSKRLPRESKRVCRDYGLFLSANRFRCGTISFSISIRLGSKAAPYHVIPVTLPSGRAKLVTKPDRTGSSPVVNITIGMVVVACISGLTRKAGPAISTSGLRDTSS